MKFSIPENEKAALMDQLQTANLKFQQTYPGDKPDRQPVHTVYGGANLFKADTCVKMGEIALKESSNLCTQLCDAGKRIAIGGTRTFTKTSKRDRSLTNKLAAMPEALRKQEPAWLSYTVYNKIIAKLHTEAVEDFRIDFEDGFGNRPDDEEDATLHSASARELATGMKNNTISLLLALG